MPPEQQAYVHLRAARFFGEVFGDSDGAAAAAERALAVMPGHTEAFSMLEALLSHSEGAPRLAQHYVEASGREVEVEKKLEFLRRAAELVAGVPRTEDLNIDIGLRILKLDPADVQNRENVVGELPREHSQDFGIDLVEFGELLNGRK